MQKSLDSVHMHTYTGLMPNIPVISHCNAFATRQAARFVSQLYERHLSKVGLTSSQFSIIAVLHHSPGITMNELADLLVMDRTSLVRAIQPLTRDGFIANAPPTSGARRLMLSLTKTGDEQYILGYPHWQAAQTEYENLVGTARADALRSTLNEITRI